MVIYQQACVVKQDVQVLRYLPLHKWHFVLYLLIWRVAICQTTGPRKSQINYIMHHRLYQGHAFGVVIFLFLIIITFRRKRFVCLSVDYQLGFIWRNFGLTGGIINIINIVDIQPDTSLGQKDVFTSLYFSQLNRCLTLFFLFFFFI